MAGIAVNIMVEDSSLECEDIKIVNTDDNAAAEPTEADRGVCGVDGRGVATMESRCDAMPLSLDVEDKDKDSSPSGRDDPVETSAESEWYRMRRTITVLHDTSSGRL